MIRTCNSFNFLHRYRGDAMNIRYLDLDGLNLRDGCNFNFTPIGLFEGDRDIITNDLFTDGQSYNRGKNKEKNLLIKGYIMGDILSNLFLLKKYLFRKGLKKLTVDLEGMPTFYVMIDMQSFGCDELSPEIISIQVTAPDPYLYTLNSSIISIGSTVNVGITFPVTFPITFGGVLGGLGVLTNYGNSIAYPIITIVGTCDTIQITNTTTGDGMRLNVSLLDTDTLIIDNTISNRGIYLNGVGRMDLKNGSWLNCATGDNIFSFSRNSLQTKPHCTITLQSRYI